MSLVPKEILLSHLQRAEGAEEVTLPIDFFRDLLYQAMPHTWDGLTDLENAEFVKTMERGNFLVAVYDIEKKLKEKNT